MDTRWYFPLGALLALLAVALGAFAAHGLPGYLGLAEAPRGSPQAEQIHRQIENFETAARYHMYHALGLVAVGVAAALARSRRTADDDAPRSELAWHLAGVAFLVGIAIFSGCLYAIALTGLRPLGAVVPIGGVAFLVGWGALAWAACGLVRE